MAVKKKATKKESKPRIKTAICSDNDSYEVFEGEVECPYCGEEQTVESRDIPPVSVMCNWCLKKFKIQWEE